MALVTQNFLHWRWRSVLTAQNLQIGFLGRLEDRDQREKHGRCLLPFEEPGWSSILTAKNLVLPYSFAFSWRMRLFKTNRKYRVLSWSQIKTLPNGCLVYSHFHAANRTPDFASTHEFTFFAVVLSSVSLSVGFFQHPLIRFVNIKVWVRLILTAIHFQ